MPEIVDFVVIIVVEVGRLMITSRFCRTVMDRNKNKLFHVLCFLMSLIITTGAYMFFNTIWLNLVSTFIGLIVLFIPYQASIRKRLLVAALILAVSTVLDLFAAFLFISRPEDKYSILSTITSVLLFLIVEVIIEKIFKLKHDRISGRHWRFFILLLLISILTMLILATDWTISKISVVAVSISILLFNLSIIYLYDRIIESAVKEHEMIILKEQMMAYSNELTLRSENEKKLKSIRHDMKLHLNEITSIAEAGDKTRLRKYLADLNESIIDTKAYADSGNKAIDSILNYMLERANTQGIKTDLHLMIPENLNVSEYDMNIILGNLLENAIEANSNIENPWIDTAMKYADGILFIEISNPYLGKIQQQGSILKSTKRDKSYHGIGLYSVKEAVNRNNGTVDINYDDGVFKAKILIDMSNFA